MPDKSSLQLTALVENAVDVISQPELTVKIKQSLKTGKPLKLKIGFDPTAADIHLGHTVLLRKLRKLQDLGHVVYLIIGDFTAKIGDPSQKTGIRPMLSAGQIKANASTYTSQVFKILNKKKTRVIYNSIWYKKMKLSDFLSLLSSYTIARALERDDFTKRLKEGKPLSVLEIAYPLIQGYDSYKLEADIEFGGTDQKFNLIVGRHLQQSLGQASQVIITMPILVGLDGKNKMSKSLDNYIGVTDSPKDMFGKIMSISDEVMWEYYRLLTDKNVDEAKQKHPKEAKLLLAKEIVSFYHSQAQAQKAAAEFEKVFSKKQLPKDLPIYRADSDSVDLVEALHKAKQAASKNEARRLLTQGSVHVSCPPNPDFKVHKELKIKVPKAGLILKIGKKRFLKITP